MTAILAWRRRHATAKGPGVCRPFFPTFSGGIPDPIVRSEKDIPHRIKADATRIASPRPKSRPKNAPISGKTADSADHLTKEAIPMEEPIPFPQQFSDTLEDATKEFLELLLRIGFAEEEQDDE
jgi:hypothetical protein